MVNVLIAEDDTDIRDAVYELLSQDGYHVVAAADGEAALQVLRTAPSPMVAILDVMMPKLLGTEVLEAILRNQRLAARHGYILITVLSLNGRKSSPANLLTHLPVPVMLLSKPFGEDDLKRAVEHIGRQLGVP